MGAFRTYRQQLVPTSHRRPQAQAFQGLLGDVEDTLVDRTKQAVKARLPLVAPSDALNALGIERQIPRGPSESDASYGARLQAAWNTWPMAGTAFGVLQALYALGYTSCALVTARGVQYALTGDPVALGLSALQVTQLSSWTIDGQICPAGATPWAPSTAYAAGAAVVPSAVPWAPNTPSTSLRVVRPTTRGPGIGFYYTATGTGNTGSTEPVWPAVLGGTVVDGGVIWTAARRDLFFTTGQAGTSGLYQPTWPTTAGSTVNDNGIKWLCGGTDFWSRFDVIISSMPSSWGGTPPAYASDEVTRIRSVIKAWAPKWTTCTRVIVIQTGGVWGYSDGTWGDGGTWGGTQTTWTPV